MSFYLRKLRRTLRLIPSTQSLSFGFSTRVNERDNASSLSDGSSPNVSRLHRTSSSIPNQTAPTRTGEGSVTSANEIAHNLLPVIIPPAESLLPMSYKDVKDILLSESLKRASSSSEEIDFVSKAVKSVRLTCDDILVDPLGGPFDCDLLQSVNERIPIDILAPTPLTCPSFRDFRMPHCDVWRKNIHSVEELSRGSESQRVNQDLSPANAAIPNVHTVFFSASGSRDSQSSSESSKDGPSPEQMHNVKEKLEALVTNLFKGRHDYGILHKQVILENNLFGDNKVSRGVTAYAMELLKLRFRIHVRYSSTAMEIMNVTSLEQSGVIRIHWRLKGVSQIQVLKFWRLFQSKNTILKEDWEWLEAFSYFHIGKDGLVHKHRIDRMMPDNERETNNLTEKLQGLLNPAKPLVS
ncbi:uncharacterized protein LOC101856596 [Aplysia californica]|uniref:Uncharacterized protein LOC101856596 n=1 Tax=Aplysia californica TaxID=6500 RepID=A0ABM0JYT2_APLCA|nr:uncharacterized protein LOC101856596 [Aplysia californica]